MTFIFFYQNRRKRLFYKYFRFLVFEGLISFRTSWTWIQFFRKCLSVCVWNYFKFLSSIEGELMHRISNIMFSCTMIQIGFYQLSLLLHRNNAEFYVQSTYHKKLHPHNLRFVCMLLRQYLKNINASNFVFFLN